MKKTRDFHYRSIHDRDGFWREEAGRIHWETPFEQVIDYSRPPFARWFVGARPTSVTTPSTAGCRSRPTSRR